MIDLSSLQFTSLIIAIVANISLAVVVFRYAEKRQSRLFFTLFVLSQTIWIGTNYLAITSTNERILDMARLTIAAAVPHPMLFFLFIYSFLRKDKLIQTAHAIPILGIILFFVLLARSPYLFTRLDSEGVPVPGVGMALFGIYAFVLIVWAFVHIFRSWRSAQGAERLQWRFIGIGLFLTFLLVLTFNFLLVVLSGQIQFIKFGHLYTLPFVLFTAYAMIRHKLLNIKVLFAELAIIILNLILLIQLVNAASVEQFVIALLVLIATALMGLLLVRSVRNEVTQRLKLQNLTNRLEEANEKLKALDKARAEFISIASHQLRTPPATIKWYLAAITAGDFGKINPEAAVAIKKAEVTNNSLISLIDDLLNVSRIERGKMEFLFEQTDLSAITQAAVEQLIPPAITKKLKLKYIKPKTKLPMIMADKEKLQQVINNLIDNAIKYTKKGSITVRLIRVKTNLVLTVTDTGKGITEDEMVQIFSKYGRGKNSIHHAAGLGLGLYVAKIVVEHHHGIINVESAGENKGSVFKVSLPIKTNLVDESELDLTKK